jgi:hypothetical protein
VSKYWTKNRKNYHCRYNLYNMMVYPPQKKINIYPRHTDEIFARTSPVTRCLRHSSRQLGPGGSFCARARRFFAYVRQQKWHAAAHVSLLGYSLMPLISVCTRGRAVVGFSLDRCGVSPRQWTIVIYIT